MKFLFTHSGVVRCIILFRRTDELLYERKHYILSGRVRGERLKLNVSRNIKIAQ